MDPERALAREDARVAASILAAATAAAVVAAATAAAAAVQTERMQIGAYERIQTAEANARRMHNNV